MVLNRMRIALHWDLDFPRIVPHDAQIFEYVRAGLVEDVKHSLKASKASARDINIFGITLLHIACKMGNLELVRLLIQEGTDLNAQDEDGETPLHRAISTSDNYDMTRLLLENGADISNKATDGKTPLHNLFNNTIGEVLIKEDWIEDTLPDSESMSITHYLAWSSKSTPEIFQRGRRHDTADLWSVDCFGRTCLHLAASRGNSGILSYLLERASWLEVERKDCQGRTPLHYAVESSRVAQVIDLLVANGCNIHAIDDLSQTALHRAARWNNLEAAKKLEMLDGEGLLLSRSTDGHLPSHLACKQKAPALREYLETRESLKESKRGSVNETDSSPVNKPRRGFKAASGCSLSKRSIVTLMVISLMLLAVSMTISRASLGNWLFLSQLWFGQVPRALISPYDPFSMRICLSDQ